MNDFRKEAVNWHHKAYFRKIYAFDRLAASTLSIKEGRTIWGVILNRKGAQSASMTTVGRCCADWFDKPCAFSTNTSCIRVAFLNVMGRVQLPCEEHTSITTSIEAETFQCTVFGFNILNRFLAFRAHCSNF
jgi:hypothetical protein